MRYRPFINKGNAIEHRGGGSIVPIISVDLAAQSAKASRERGNQNDLTYLVKATGMSADEVRDSIHPDLPQLGESAGDGTYVQDLSVDLRGQSADGSVDVWEYRVLYAAQRSDGGESAEDPLDREPEIQWGGVDSATQIKIDLDHYPIANSAGDYFGTERERGNATVVITRNEGPDPAAKVVLYSHTVNASPWYGVPAYKAKLGRITAMRKKEGKHVYWEVTYSIEFISDADGNDLDWRLRPIDQGPQWKYVDSSSGEPVVRRRNFVNDDGFAYEGLLDGSGGRLAEGATPLIANSGQGFRVYREVNFAALNLPNPFA